MVINAVNAQAVPKAWKSVAQRSQFFSSSFILHVFNTCPAWRHGVDEEVGCAVQVVFSHAVFGVDVEHFFDPGWEGGWVRGSAVDWLFSKFCSPLYQSRLLQFKSFAAALFDTAHD